MFLGIDIGTSSTKAIVSDAAGTVLASAVRPHRSSSPHPGWYEHDAEQVWWSEVRDLARELTAAITEPIRAVCCSGIGPAALLTDAENRPLRPAILYGIDTRSAPQVTRQNAEFGEDLLLEHLGNPLSTQSVGPKLTWVAENEPPVWEAARRLYSAPGWVVHRLTGEYTLDHYSASTSDPLYDLTVGGYWERGWQGLDRIERPRLVRSTEIAGQVTPWASEQTGLPVGTPVLAGTIDALAEAYSVGCEEVGDTMVMYASTIFFIQVAAQARASRLLWAAEGLRPGTASLAAGMATGGLVPAWITESLGQGYSELLEAAAQVPPGSEGLLLLPYFSGERTPIFDPAARGAWVGLTLDHRPGHLYRSALEGLGFGIRHNLDAMASLGAAPRRLVAVGGGTAQRLWTQIVSDITGLPQDLPTVRIGASFGDARLAAEAVGVDTAGWNPIAERIEPNLDHRDVYDELFASYLRAYPALQPTMHELTAVATRRSNR